MKKMKQPKHRNANAVALALPKFRPMVIPNKKKEFKLKHKKFMRESNKIPIVACL